MYGNTVSVVKVFGVPRVTNLFPTFSSLLSIFGRLVSCRTSTHFLNFLISLSDSLLILYYQNSTVLVLHLNLFKNMLNSLPVHEAV